MTNYIEGAYSILIEEWSDRQLYDAIAFETEPDLRAARVLAARRLGRLTPPDLAGRRQRYR